MVSSTSFLLPEELKEGFRTVIKKRRFPHALLMYGPKGIGVKELALALAESLLCDEEKILEPCDCRNCKRIRESNHPDVKVFECTEAASIKVAQIRELIGWARFHPLESGKKILIMEEVEKLSDSALNAFLKLLEEPPPSTSLILLAENPVELKPTLLSRCFRVRLPAVSAGNIQESLVKEGASHDEAHYISLLAKGIPARAQELLEEDVFASDEKRLKALLSHYSYEMVEEGLGSLSKSSNAEAKRKVIFEYLRVAQIFLRDTLIYTEKGEKSEDSLFFKNRKEWIRNYSLGQTGHDLCDKINRLEIVRADLERYANPKLAIMAITETIGEPLLGD